MKLSTDQVKKVAKLANLPLLDEEKYTDQLSAILDYIDQLDQVDTADVEPTFNVTGRSNIWQPDEIEASLSQEDALSNAPRKAGGFFLTRGVFNNE